MKTAVLGLCVRYLQPLLDNKTIFMYSASCNISQSMLHYTLLFQFFSVPTTFSFISIIIVMIIKCGFVYLLRVMSHTTMWNGYAIHVIRMEYDYCEYTKQFIIADGRSVSHQNAISETVSFASSPSRRKDSSLAKMLINFPKLYNFIVCYEKVLSTESSF